MKNDSLGDRMKRYEGTTSAQLMRRTPVIIRIDGKAFHTFTRGLDKPFDQSLHEAMVTTMARLCGNIQGAVFAYTQSDEISILLQDWEKHTTDAWFDYKIQKMTSIAASIATAAFNGYYKHPSKTDFALFDARVFNIPFEEVTNYFVWRQQDAVRNSINALGQAHFSHKSLQGKNVNQVQDMLIQEKGINWNDVPTRFKRGVCVVEEFYATGDKGEIVRIPKVDSEIPIFTQDRNYVERHLDRSDLNAQQAA